MVMLFMYMTVDKYVQMTKKKRRSKKMYRQKSPKKKTRPFHVDDFMSLRNIQPAHIRTL